MKTVYKVSNLYATSGVSKHRSPEAALNAAAKREGEGWIVTDDKGNQWTMYGGKAEISVNA
jgi:hypothetical protein